MTESLTAYLAAQSQSGYQARRGQLGHDGPPGLETAGQRLSAHGQTWTAYGECVAEATTISDAVQRWLNHEPHRVIMLDPTFTHAGAAVVGRFATAVFFR